MSSAILFLKVLSFKLLVIRTSSKTSAQHMARANLGLLRELVCKVTLKSGFGDIGINEYCLFFKSHVLGAQEWINEVTSVTSRVPWGSVLGAVVFYVFIDDLDTEVKCTLSEIAHDIRLGGAVDSPEERSE